MKATTKIILIALCLTAFFITSAVLFADDLDRIFSAQYMTEWFRARPLLGWLAGIALISADLFTPMPAPVIVTALGLVYGGFLGSLFGTTGLLCVGLLGYGIARLGGERAARRIASEEEMAAIRDGFNRWGFAAIALTRMLPMIPEILSVLAGLSKMDFRRYFLALLIGSAPIGIMFAFLGEFFEQNPLIGFGTAFLLPLALLLVLRFTKIMKF